MLIWKLKRTFIGMQQLVRVTFKKNKLYILRQFVVSLVFLAMYMPALCVVGDLMGRHLD